MLCILAVFIPSFFMQGAAQALFVPLSLAVGFAMVSSYLLSSTFVPVLSTWLLRHRDEAGKARRRSRASSGSSRPMATPCRGSCAGGGRWCRSIWPSSGFVIIGVGRDLGMEIFPKVDAGRFQLRMRAPPERESRRPRSSPSRSSRRFGRKSVRTTSRSPSATSGSSRRAIRSTPSISGPAGRRRLYFGSPCNKERTVAVEGLKERLRTVLAGKMPEVRFSFEPADIVSEVMSFGSPTPVEFTVNGPNLAENHAYAEKVRAELSKVPSLRDLQFVQALDYPTVGCAG